VGSGCDVVSDLLVIVPSRGRPENVAQLLESWKATVAGDSALLVVTDLDDPDLERYAEAYRKFPPTSGSGRAQALVHEPRERLGPTLNRHSGTYASEYFAIGFMGDDHRPRTPGWDERMVAALREMGTGIVYGNDLFQREALPTAVVMTSDIIRTLGYMVPPGLIHLFMDNFWLGLGQALGCIRYLDDVVIEHLHPLARSAEWDAGYREVNSQAMYARDHATFLRWVREESPAALAKLRELIAAKASA
jgi:hypothetical protein